MTKRTALIPALVAGAVLACVAAVLAVPAKEAGAAFPGKNGRIAFAEYADAGGGNTTSEVFTVLPDGTGTRQLTTASSSGGAEFSPDGTRIAYSGRRDFRVGYSGIWVMDRSGTSKRALTDDDSLAEGGPDWSPDGTKIAFLRQEQVLLPDGHSEWRNDIWVMAADGSGQRKLTDDPDTEGAPAWSPDGTKIAFNEGGDIWTMNPDGSGLRNITHTGYVNGRYVAEYGPDFSPDGRKLAFSSNRQYNKYDVYTMNLDGTALTNVTSTRYVEEESPVWSPSGTRIAYYKQLTEDAAGTGNAEIFTKNADGSGRPKNVTNTLHEDEYPSDWGPAPTTTSP